MCVGADGQWLACGSRDNSVYIYAVTESGRKFTRAAKCSVSWLVTHSSFLLVCVCLFLAISREFGVALPWEMLYAYDFAVIPETEEELINGLNEWKDIVESKR